MARFGIYAILMVVATEFLRAQHAAEAPCDSLHSVALREDGERALRNKQFAAAVDDFQRAFAKCSTDHAILLRLSEAEARSRNFDAALQAARRFVELEPASRLGRLTLGNTYFMAQRLPEAEEQADQVLHSQADEPGALKLKGNIQYLAGHLPEALNTFVRLLDRHPEDEEGAYMLGRIYYQEGRIEQAAGQFQRVLRLNPKSFKAFDNLGLCFQAQGDANLAKRYFLTAIQTSENEAADYDWAYANLANLLLEQGDAGSAYAAAAKAADRNPFAARNFFLGGKALAQLGKSDLSVNWLQRSIALDPAYPEPLYVLAKVYTDLGRQDEARATLEKFRVVKAAAPRERK